MLPRQLWGHESEPRYSKASRGAAKPGCSSSVTRSDTNLAAATLWLIFKLARTRGGPGRMVTPESWQQKMDVRFGFNCNYSNLSGFCPDEGSIFFSFLDNKMKIAQVRTQWEPDRTCQVTCLRHQLTFWQQTWSIQEGQQQRTQPTLGQLTLLCHHKTRQEVWVLRHPVYMCYERDLINGYKEIIFMVIQTDSLTLIFSNIHPVCISLLWLCRMV